MFCPSVCPPDPKLDWEKSRRVALSVPVSKMVVFVREGYGPLK